MNLGSLQRFLRLKDIPSILPFVGSLAWRNVRVVADVAQLGRFNRPDFLRAERPSEVGTAIVTKRVTLLVLLISLIPCLLLAGKPLVASFRQLLLCLLGSPVDTGDLLRSALRALEPILARRALIILHRSHLTRSRRVFNIL